VGAVPAGRASLNARCRHERKPGRVKHLRAHEADQPMSRTP
jgi:hypothetical protein